MSGEMMMAPAAPVVAIVAVGALAAGVVILPSKLAFQLIDSLVKEQVQEAQRKAEEHERKTQEWHAELAGQEKKRNAWVEHIAHFQEKVETLLTAGLAAIPSSVQEEPGRLSQRKKAHLAFPSSADRITITACREQLDVLTAMLDGLPAELKESKESPVPSLRAYLVGLQLKLQKNQSIGTEELTSFRKTVQQSCATFQERHQDRQKRQRGLHDRLVKLRKDLRLRLSLEDVEDHRAELGQLLTQVTSLGQGQELQKSIVDELEGKVGAVCETVETNLKARATRQVLAERVAHHLSGMGYESVDSFAQPVAKGLPRGIMRIPGGEHLQIAIQRNGSLSFEVVSERGTRNQKKESVSREQEQRWCKDARTLLSLLLEDGFNYSIKFERQVQEQSIEVVRTVTPEEILRDDKTPATEDRKPVIRRVNKPKKRFFS